LLAFLAMASPPGSLAMEGTCGPLRTDCHLISSSSDKLDMLQVLASLDSGVDDSSSAVEKSNSASTVLATTTHAAAVDVVSANAGNTCPTDYTKITSKAACIASLDILGPGSDPVRSYPAYDFKGSEDDADWPAGCYECWGMRGCRDGVWFNAHQTGAVHGKATPICAKNLEPLTTGGVLWMGDSDTDYWTTTRTLAPGSYNVAVGGYTCEDLLGDLDAMLAVFLPSVVHITCGENDLSNGASPTTAFRYFEQVLEKITATGARAIIMGTKDEPSERAIWSKYARYDAKVRALAESLAVTSSPPAKLSVVDVNAGFKALGNPRSFYADDRLHLSAEGYALWDDWSTLALADNSCVVWLSGTCLVSITT